MANLHVLKVFVGVGGGGGNPLGVFLDGHEVPERERQGVAADLGFPETVFVDDPERGELRIFTPKTGIPFAGHPLVGAAWLLMREGFEVPALHPPAGEVFVRSEGEVVFVVGWPDWSPPFSHVELGSPEKVDALTGPPSGHDLVGVWAWDNEEAGLMRVRVFAPRIGVEEDEATGSHAIKLCGILKRQLAIRQGEGSLILAEPWPDGSVEIGGNTELVEVCEYRQGGKSS